MISFDRHKAIDLSPRVTARVHRVDGTIEEGNTDPYGKPWVMQEGRFAGDNSLYTLYSAPQDDEVWHQERMTSHHGAHVQGGKGHISHWVGAAPGMKGLWEMPLETFLGDAAVFNLTHLTPHAITDASEYPLGEGYRIKSQPGDIRGREILPEHLGGICEGDILLITSPFRGLEQPWLSTSTVNWLIQDCKIKMLGLEAEGVVWQYDLKVSAPDNSPIRRLLLGANIPIVHPLVNIGSIKSDRVVYFGVPLNMEKFEASFIRAMAFEAPEDVK